MQIQNNSLPEVVPSSVAVVSNYENNPFEGCLKWTTYRSSKRDVSKKDETSSTYTILPSEIWSLIFGNIHTLAGTTPTRDLLQYVIGKIRLTSKSGKLIASKEVIDRVNSKTTYSLYNFFGRFIKDANIRKKIMSDIIEEQGPRIRHIKTTGFSGNYEELIPDLEHAMHVEDLEVISPEPLTTPLLLTVCKLNHLRFLVLQCKPQNANTISLDNLFANLSHLQELSLYKFMGVRSNTPTHFTISFSRKTPPPTYLEKLFIKDSVIASESENRENFIDCIKTNKNLQIMDISFLDHSIYKEIAPGLTNLRELWFSDVKESANDETMQILSPSLTRLESLFIRSSKITIPGLATVMTSLKNLRNIDRTDLPLQSEFCSLFKNMEYLFINDEPLLKDFNFQFAHLAYFSKCLGNLKILELRIERNGEALNQLVKVARQLTELHTLKIESIFNENSNLKLILLKLNKLKTLTLVGNISFKAVVNIHKMGRLFKKIENLTLEYGSFKENHLQAIIPYSKNLKKLTMKTIRCSENCFTLLQDLRKKAPNLQTFNHCENFTKAISKVDPNSIEAALAMALSDATMDSKEPFIIGGLLG